MTVLFIQACGRKLEPEEPCNFVQNSQMQRVSWKDRMPVKLYIHASVPTQYYSSIELAVDQWNRAMGREMMRIELTGVSGDNIPKRDGASMIYWLNQWEDDRRTEQARTTVYWTGDRIYEADIRINGEFFSFYGGDGAESFSGVDMESLMVHEFGHVMGLSHNGDKGSVMAVTLSSGTLRRTPGKDDLDSLRCEY